MCYDIKASLEAQKSRAQRSGNLDAAQEIEALLSRHTTLPQSHINGFNHPVLGIYTDELPGSISLGRWGLIPHWFPGPAQELKFNTLNARAESMFEKAAFAEAAERHRGILMIDGFYEHQHRSSGIYPHFIYRKDHKPMALACIFEPMPNDKHNDIALSFSIVTIQANELMRGIHNNPRLKQARMPLILTPEMEEQWLLGEGQKSEVFISSGTRESKFQSLNEKFVRRSQEIVLDCHTVAPLRKNSIKTTKSTDLKQGQDASAPFNYPELSQNWDLFSGLN